MLSFKTKSIFTFCSQPGARSFLDPLGPMLQSHGWQQLHTNLGFNRATHSCKQSIFEAFEAVTPDVLVTSIGRNPLEKMLLNRANELGIPSFHIFDAWYDYIPRIAETFGDIEAPQNLIVLDRFAANEMIAAGISENKLAICGHPAWEQIKISPPQCWRRRILVVDQVFSFEGGKKNLGYDEGDFFEVIKQSIIRGFGDTAETVFIQHPRRLSQSAQIPDDWRVVQLENVNLSSFNLVIGAFSSVMIESYLLGIPTVSIQPAMFGDDRSILSRRGLISMSTNVMDLSQIPEIDVSARASFAASFQNSTNRVLDVITGS